MYCTIPDRLDPLISSVSVRSRWVLWRVLEEMQPSRGGVQRGVWRGSPRNFLEKRGAQNWSVEVVEVTFPEDPYPPNLGGGDSHPKFGG